MEASQRPSARLMVGIILTTLLVFTGDIMTPLGYAEVILYLVPLLLSSFLYEPQLPIRIAGAATVLVAAGFFLSPPGAPAAYAILNRVMATIVLWTVAFGLRQLIRDRQTHLHEEQRWQLLAQQTNDILWDWDLRTNAHWWSNNAIATLGYDPMQEPSIEAWHSRLHPDDRTRIQTSIQSAIDSGQSGWSEEYRFRMRDHSYRTFLDRGRIIRNTSGTAIRMIGAMIDITRQEYLRAALHKSEERLALATQGSTDALWDGHRLPGRVILDPENPIWWSAQIRSFLALDGSEPFDTIAHWAQRLHPDDAEQVFTALRDHFDHHQPFDVEYRIRTNRGDYRWLRGRGQAIWDAAGEPQRMSGSCQDITDRKVAELALQQSEQQLREAHRIAHLGTWELDHTSATLTWSSEVFRIFGVQPEQFGSTYGAFLELVHPDDRRFVDEAYQTSLTTRAPYDIVHRVLRPDRDTAFVREQCVTFYASDGRPLRSAGTAQDITELHRAEDALRESEQRKAAVLNAALDCIITIDRDQQVIEFNPAAETTFGYTREQVLGKPIGELIIPPSLREQHRRGMAHYLATGDGPLLDRRVELTAMKADGSEFPIELSLTRISDHAPLLFTAFIRDITEQQRAAESLRNSEARLTDAQRIAGVGSWEWDMTSDITWSDENYRIFGYVPHSVVPSYDLFLDALHPDDRAPVTEALQRTLNDNAPYDLTCRIVRPSGEQRYLRCRGEVTRDKTGTPLRMAGTVEDVTERTEVEARLRNAYKQLQDMTRHTAKAEENERRRIAREIHDELGQLLTAMRFQLTALKKSQDTSSAEKKVENRTARLNDLLDLSHTMLSQVRQLSASLRPAMLDDLGLIPAVQAHAQQFEVRTGIACDVVVEETLAERTFDEATSSSVFRIVQELLTNVLRHARAMAVTITFAHDGPQLVVTVEDNGTGISTADSTRHDSYGLKGISERAALLGGTFAIGPSPAEGTVATLRIPLSVLSPAPLQHPPHQEDHENPVGR